jgi:hypothetical protein
MEEIIEEEPDEAGLDVTADELLEHKKSSLINTDSRDVSSDLSPIL